MDIKHDPLSQRPYDIDQVCLHRIVRDGLCTTGNSPNLWEATVQHWQFYLLVLLAPYWSFLGIPSQRDLSWGK